MDPKFKDNASPTVEESAGRRQFDELTDSEIRLLRDMTLSQVRDVHSRSQSALQLLSGVWWQIEREARRREREVAQLEKLFFAR